MKSDRGNIEKQTEHGQSQDQRKNQETEKGGKRPEER